MSMCYVSERVSESFLQSLLTLVKTYPQLMNLHAYRKGSPKMFRDREVVATSSSVLTCADWTAAVIWACSSSTDDVRLVSAECST